MNDKLILRSLKTDATGHFQVSLLFDLFWLFDRIDFLIFVAYRVEDLAGNADHTTATVVGARPLRATALFLAGRQLATVIEG